MANEFKKGNVIAMTHGDTRHDRPKAKEYMIWDSMKQRCSNPNHPAYKWYGAKGIKVCKRWEKYENFLADMGRKPEGKSLDRFPNRKGNYEPTNCRWATDTEQHRNKISNKIVEYNGEKKCVADWCEELGLDYRLIIMRLYSGWDTHRAFNNTKINCNVSVNKLSLDGEVVGKYESIREAADKNNIQATNISGVINGRVKTAGGFRWERSK